MNIEHGEIIIYQSDDGQTRIEVQLEEETVWLTQTQMTELYNRNKRTISEHIRNVFKESELDENAVVRKFRTTASDGNKRIGSLLFLIFLRENSLLEQSGINENGLVVLALLIAESDPKQKNLMIKLIMNLLANGPK